MAGSFKSCLSHPALHGTTRLDKQRPRGALTWLPRLYHFEKGTLFLIQISWRLFWIQTDRAPFKYPRPGYYNTKGFWRRASWISLPSRIIKKQKKKKKKKKKERGIIIVQRCFSLQDFIEIKLLLEHIIIGLRLIFRETNSMYKSCVSSSKSCVKKNIIFLIE